jgi:Flp pilus assembly pilin Flp
MGKILQSLEYTLIAGLVLTVVVAVLVPIIAG